MTSRTAGIIASSVGIIGAIVLMIAGAMLWYTTGDVTLWGAFLGGYVFGRGIGEMFSAVNDLFDAVAGTYEW